MDKIAGYLNLALRAGKLALGVDNIRAAKHKLYAILADTGLAAGSLERLKRCAAERKIPLYVFDGQLAELIHKEKCRAAGLADGNIWNGMRAWIEQAEAFKPIESMIDDQRRQDGAEALK
ncbi:hypothetical protein FACS1894211_06960 [Clostridia bacterium]|nr:hypothetical protein FACS1894211_06960 [Clostridia bacterium]